MPSVLAVLIRRIVDDIDVRGHIDPKRLTIVTPWFEERPERLPVFGLWTARHAAYRKDKEYEVPKGEAVEILWEARSLLGRIATRKSLFDRIDPEAANALRLRVKTFLSEFVREDPEQEPTLHCWPLYLVEKGMALYTGLDSLPSDGYQLAVDRSINYNPRYGTNLNGPSRTRILDLAKFVQHVEAMEEKAEQEQATG